MSPLWLKEQILGSTSMETEVELYCSTSYLRTLPPPQWSSRRIEEYIQIPIRCWWSPLDLVDKIISGCEWNRAASDWFAADINESSGLLSMLNFVSDFHLFYELTGKIFIGIFPSKMQNIWKYIWRTRNLKGSPEEISASKQIGAISQTIVKKF